MPWSDWQDGDVIVRTASAVGLALPNRSDGVKAPDVSADAAALMTEARDNVAAGSGPTYADYSPVGYFESLGANSPSDPPIYGIGWSLQQFRRDYGPDDGQTKATISNARMYETGAAFDATTALSERKALPALLGTLTPGVDYAAIPGSPGVYVEYDESDPPVATWLPWQLHYFTTRTASSYAATAPTSAPPGGFHIYAYDGDLGTSAPGWIGTGATGWALLATVTESAVNPSSPVEATISVELNGVVTGGKWNVAAVPSIADPAVPLGTGSIPAPPTGNFDQWSFDASLQVNYRYYLVGPGSPEVYSDAQFISEHLPQVQVRQPRWRYWIPGSLGGYWGVRLGV